MVLRRVKINGIRGKWIAEVEGKWLAVLHSSQRVGNKHHFAPFTDDEFRSSKYPEFEKALKENELVVVQRDRSREDFSRDGYIGVFWFTDLNIDPSSGIRLRYLERYADHKT